MEGKRVTRSKFDFAMKAFALEGGIIDYQKAKKLGVSKSSYYRYYAYLCWNGFACRTSYGVVNADFDTPLFYVKKDRS